MRINFDEIKILCDIDACAVIYSPFNSIPEIWPPNSEVHKVIEKFEILTEEEQTEASVNHEEFLTQTITKDEKVKRLTEDNNDKFMKELMYACLNGNLGDLAMDDSMAGHEILGVYSYVYIKKKIYKFEDLKFVFWTYLYVIFFKKFGSLLRMFHLASPRTGIVLVVTCVSLLMIISRSFIIIET